MGDAKQLKPIAEEIERLNKNANAIKENISTMMERLDPILTPPASENEGSKGEVKAAPSALASTLNTINSLLESSIDKLHKTIRRVEV